MGKREEKWGEVKRVCAKKLKSIRSKQMAFVGDFKNFGAFLICLALCAEAVHFGKPLRGSLE